MYFIIKLVFDPFLKCWATDNIVLIKYMELHVQEKHWFILFICGDDKYTDL